MYIDSARLYFSDEGIFLKTRFNEWKSIGHIYHDLQGYYLTKSFSSSNQVSSCEDATESEVNIWECPSCGYENTTTTGVCERCLWPLYDWD